ncbi:MAG: phage tail assembly chaperone [Pseudomonadota bacterium]
MSGHVSTSGSDGDEVDWNLLMRFGLGALGLAPRDFWAMTPGEFDAAAKGRMGALTDGAVMTQSRFDELAARFPDEKRAQ